MDKLTFIVFLFIIVIKISNAQYYNIIEFDSICINGLDNKSDISEILDKFGEADSIFNPHLECGEFAEENVDSATIIRYIGIDFLNVDGLTFFNNVIFNKLDSNTVFRIGNIELNEETSINDLKVLFPNSYSMYIEESSGVFRLWLCKECNSQIQLFFMNKKLISFDYWSPC